MSFSNNDVLPDCVPDAQEEPVIERKRCCPLVNACFFSSSERRPCVPPTHLLLKWWRPLRSCTDRTKSSDNGASIQIQSYQAVFFFSMRILHRSCSVFIWTPFLTRSLFMENFSKAKQFTRWFLSVIITSCCSHLFTKWLICTCSVSADHHPGPALCS